MEVKTCRRGKGRIGGEAQRQDGENEGGGGGGGQRCVVRGWCGGVVCRGGRQCVGQAGDESS